jgi:hypothetical protein
MMQRGYIFFNFSDEDNYKDFLSKRSEDQNYKKSNSSVSSFSDDSKKIKEHSSDSSESKDKDD